MGKLLVKAKIVYLIRRSVRCVSERGRQVSIYWNSAYAMIGSVELEAWNTRAPGYHVRNKSPVGTDLGRGRRALGLLDMC